jgi:hypothetical protein
MPNWTDCCVTIEGDASVLKHIADNNFDFEKLHPCPSGVNEYDWCVAHWGTKWTARDIDIDYDGKEYLQLTFRTAWCVPHGFLAYLTLQHPSLKIIADWTDDTYELVGQTTYSGGNFTSKSFDPSLYTLVALEEASKENPWFSYDEYLQCADREDIERLEKKVVVQVLECSYDDFIKKVF